MQLSRGFVLLALTAALAGCTDTTAPAPGAGQIVAKWAGQIWMGSAGAELRHYGGAAGDSLFVTATRMGVPQVEETIVAEVRFTGIGTYQIGPGAARMYELVGGDVLTGEYTTSQDATGSLVITKYDSVAGTIEGVLSFDGVSTMPNGRYGTQATFEDGRFQAMVLNPQLQ
jgi:hypothetical protein